LIDNLDYSAQISFIDIREYLPSIDPENLSDKDILDILLYLFSQIAGFRDRGHELNNKETAWVNGILFRLNLRRDEDINEYFVVERIGSSMDKIALLSD
jgi:hypothetical protein